MKKMSKKNIKKKSLDYHSSLPRGKIGIVSTKQCSTQEDLSLAYTPGVADPCIEIKNKEDNVWKYTNRGNAIAVVTDGTAVLGLGDIGPEASIPVMEGKAVLFKKFADVDAFPICLQNVRKRDGHTNPDAVVDVVKKIEPGFGGINLEDIASPACFEIEERLKKELDIPVFHDDQHGTAIISLAALLNGLELVGKKISEIKVVVNGAGAAGIACAKFYEHAGVRRKNIFMCDRHGVVYNGRKVDMNKYKNEFAQDTDSRGLSDAIKGADVFLGVSVANVVSESMVKSMADKSILFAMANPVPEIMPRKAKKAGAYIVATGRSDFDNQVNNVLGFPGIFRGALDCHARSITEDMKMAASRALAEITREEVPNSVKKFLLKAYKADAKRGMFNGKNPLSKDYVIPKPFDPRVVPRLARGVAEAAMRNKVARVKIKNLRRYEREVSKRVG
jgi:malate dehydrogenase (oxaloacetate-decarboxylating)(NADP+)